MTVMKSLTLRGVVHPDALPEFGIELHQDVGDVLGLGLLDMGVLDALRRDIESALAVTLDLAVYKKDLGSRERQTLVKVDRSLSSSW
jgi:hypothetical protein